jgi:hypothetical protein
MSHKNLEISSGPELSLKERAMTFGARVVRKVVDAFEYVGAMDGPMILSPAELKAMTEEPIPQVDKK